MSKERLMLDITSAITYISDICRDPDIGNRYGKLENWKKINRHIYDQILDESKDPVYSKIKKIFDEHELCITDSGKKKLSEIIDNFGSQMEKNNLQIFMKNVSIVNDDPSDRFMILDDKKWTKFNKNIFGTVDKTKIKIITANINLLDYIINELNIEIMYIAHRPRCFVGKKFEINKVKEY